MSQPHPLPLPRPTGRGNRHDVVSGAEQRVLPERWQSRSSQWDRLKPDARRMRQNQTPAEAKVWSALRNKQVAGLKFRRQHAVDRYIVDFYCHEMRLVIEVDGPTHDATVEEDAIRRQVIENQGITFLRFKNDEVFDDLPSVLERIMNAAGIASGTPASSEQNQASIISPPPRRTGRAPRGGVRP